VPRDPLIDALIAEIDQALAAARAARRIVAELEKSARAVEKARSRARDSEESGVDVSRSLRFAGMTVREAAVTLGVSDERVRVMLRNRELSGVEFGGRIGWRLARENVHEVAAQWEAQRRGRSARPTPTVSRRPRRSRTSG
jgi:excisionase family DNA binding protein